jgi:hypothetical protein
MNKTGIALIFVASQASLVTSVLLVLIFRNKDIGIGLMFLTVVQTTFALWLVTRREA